MTRIPDGIVTVHLDGDRYRGAYYFRGDDIVVTAYGLPEGAASMERSTGVGGCVMRDRNGAHGRPGGQDRGA